MTTPAERPAPDPEPSKPQPTHWRVPLETTAIGGAAAVLSLLILHLDFWNAVFAGTLASLCYLAGWYRERDDGEDS